MLNNGDEKRWVKDGDMRQNLFEFKSCKKPDKLKHI